MKWNSDDRNQDQDQGKQSNKNMNIERLLVKNYSNHPKVELLLTVIASKILFKYIFKRVH